VVIPDSVTTMNNGVFSRCYALESVTLSNGLTKLDEGIFWENYALKSIEIPYGIEEIVDNCFYMSGLESIEIPGSVRKIGDWAFESCQNMKTAFVPGSVEEMGDGVFADCSSELVVTVEYNSTAHNVLMNNEDLTLNVLNVPEFSGQWYYETFEEELEDGSVVTYARITGYEGEMPMHVDFPSELDGYTVAEIGGNAFQDRGELRSVSIPGSVRKIIHSAFQNCGGLSSVTLNKGLVEIGNHAFAYTNLTEVELPGTVKTLVHHAFAGLNNNELKKLHIPAGVEVIENNLVEGSKYMTFVLETEDCLAKEYAENNNIPYDAGNGYNLHVFELNYEGDGHVGGEGYWSPYVIGGEEEHEYLFQLFKFGSSKLIAESGWTTDDWFCYTFTDSGEYVCDVYVRDVVDGEVVAATQPVPSALITVSNFDENGYGYALLTDGTAKLTGIDRERINGDVVLPTEIAGYTVTAIGESLFYGCDNIDSVVVPEGYTRIDGMAFSETYSVKSVSLPSTLKTIADHAFWHAYALESITIPGSVEKIGNFAFDSCGSLKNVVIQDGASGLGEHAFRGCGSLESVEIAGSIGNVENYAFYDCGSLTEVKLGNGIHTIGDTAFGNCYQLESIALPESVITIENAAFSGCGSLESINLPNGLTYLGDEAFRDCHSLMYITIPGSVGTIKGSAFSNCGSLVEVELNEGITTIEGGAFDNCGSLRKINIPDSVNRIDWHAFHNCGSLGEVEFPAAEMSIDCDAFAGSSITMVVTVDSAAYHYARSENIRYIAVGTASANQLHYVFNEEECTAKIIGYGFEGEEYIELSGTLTIPGTVEADGKTYTVTEIGDNALRGYWELTGLVIPDSVVRIGNAAFADNDNLSSLQMSANVQYIGQDAFINAKRLEEVSIPASCTFLGGGAFAYCDKLMKLTIFGMEVSFDDGCTLDGTNKVVIYCQEGSSAQAFANEKGIPVVIIDAEGNILQDCLAIRDVEIYNSVGHIGGTAIWKIKAVGYEGNREYQYQLLRNEDEYGEPSEWTKEESFSFTFTEDGDYQLLVRARAEAETGNEAAPANVLEEDFVVEGGSTGVVEEKNYIYSDDFVDDEFLFISHDNEETPFRYIIVGENEVRVTGYNQEYPETLVIPETIPVPDEEAEGGYRDYTVIEIGAYAFSDNDQIRNVEIPESVVSIMFGAFARNHSLTSVEIPEGVDRIAYETFLECGNLEAVTLFSDENGNGNITEIGNYAFAGCESLSNIELPEGLAEIGEGAFEGCGELNALTLPQSLTTIRNGAFKSTGLTAITIPDEVTTMEWDAFAESSLKSVTLGTGLTYLDSCVFMNCHNLEEINLEESNITRIGGSAFEHCCSLKSIVMPDSVTEIAHRVFCDCHSLVSAKMSNGLITTGMATFENCHRLHSVTLPKNLTEIGNWAFKNCHRLSGIEIPQTVNSIGECAFEECHDLQELTLPGGEMKLGSGIFNNAHNVRLIVEAGSRAHAYAREWGVNYVVNGTADAGRLYYEFDGESMTAIVTGYNGHDEEGNWIGIEGTLTIPGSVEMDGEIYAVTEIANNAFKDADRLSALVIESGVEIIGEWAFAGCHNLRSITLPDTLKRIEVDAFNSCHSLVEVSIPASCVFLGGGAFANCESLRKIEFTETEIDFHDKHLLDNSPLVVIYCKPDTSAEAFAIEKEIPYNNGVTNTLAILDVRVDYWAGWIGETGAWKVFANGNNLQYAYKLYKGNELALETEWGASDTFSYEFTEAGLYSIEAFVRDATKPDTVVSKGCGDIFGISNYSEETGFNYALSNKDENGVWKVAITGYDHENFGYPDGVLTIPATIEGMVVNAIFNNAFEGQNGFSRLVLNDTIESIGHRAFRECGDLESIDFANSPVYEIGENAFENCGSLGGIVLSETTRWIGDRAFVNSGIDSIKLSRDLAYLGGNAFEACGELTSVDMTACTKLEEIQHHTFCNCDALESIVFPDCVRMLRREAFADCNALKKVTLNSGLLEIEDYAFAGCCELTEINLENTDVYYIAEGAFEHCCSLKSIVMPNSMNEVGEGAFNNCHSLESVALGKYMPAIGKGAFEECYNLKSVTNTERLINIEGWAFKRCHNLSNLELPESLEKVGRCAFEECHSLGELYFGENAADLSEDMFHNADIVMVVKPDTDALNFAIENEMAYRIVGATASPEGFIFDIYEEGIVITGYDAEMGPVGDLTIPAAMPNEEGENIPVVAIGAWAFSGCDQLMSVTIPASVKRIENNAFEGSWRMHTVTIAEGSQLETIGDYAFGSCEYLSEINLEAAGGLKSIGERAFGRCHHLFELTIPASVEQIGDEMTEENPFIVLYVTEGTAGEDYAIEMGLAYDKGDGIVLTVQALDVVQQAGWIGETGAWETSWIGGKGDVTLTYNLYRASESYEKPLIEATTETYIEYEFTENGVYMLEVIATDSEGNTASKFANERIIISEYDEASGYFVSVVSNEEDSAVREVAITGAGEKITGAVEIPASLTLNGVTYNVVEICGGAFEDRDDITSIVVPEGVRRVGQYAFIDMSELIYAELPSTINEVNEGTFKYCRKLETVVLPSAEAIGDQAFYQNYKLKNFTLPANLKEIGAEAFADCHSLKLDSIPDGVWSIGSYAFAGCYKLGRIWFPESVKEIGEWIFETSNYVVVAANVGAPILEYAVENGYAIDPVGNANFGNISFMVQSNEVWITGYNGYAIGNLEIPAQITVNGTAYPVTTICENALSGQHGLTGVKLPASVTEIQGNAFSYCRQLRSVDASAGGLTTISYSAFEGCENLSSVSLPDGLQTIENGAFAYCASLGVTTIPASVTKMEDNIFLDCNRLALNVTAGTEAEDYAKKYGIPYNTGEGFDLMVLEVAVEREAGWIEEDASWRVYAIGGGDVYQYQYQLYRNGVAYGEASEWINEDTFEYTFEENGTYELHAKVKDETGNVAENVSREMYISSTHMETRLHYAQLNATEAMITGIDSDALGEELNIPEKIAIGTEELTVVGIGGHSFAYSEGLASVTLPDTIRFIGEYAFAEDQDLAEINLPEDLEEIGECAFLSCMRLEEITLPSELKSIGHGAFVGCKGLTEISIPDSVDEIGNAAFANCTELASVKLPAGLTMIRNEVFYNCTALKGIVIPETVAVIKESAFSESGLETITIPASVEYIEKYAFAFCYDLTTLNLNEGLIEIGESAFASDAKLTELKLPDSVERVRGDAFDGCSALANVELSKNLQYIANWTFADCGSLTSIVIPESVQSIGAYAFVDCVNLKTVTMPTGSNMTAIEQSAFYHCAALESIEIPDSVTIIEPIAFDSCYSLKSVNLPANLEFLADFVFANCHALESIEIPQSVELIGKAALAECYALTEVVIPDGVTSIGVDCFYKCESLVSVTVPASVVEIGYNEDKQRHAFAETAEDFELIVDAGSHAMEYAVAYGVAYRLNAMEYGDFLYLSNESGATIMGYTGSEASVTVPETINELTVTEIGDGAFEGNTTLEAIDLPDSITVIGVKAFANCSNLAVMT